MGLLICSCNPIVVAEPETPVVSWEDLRALVPSFPVRRLPRWPSMGVSFFFIASATPQLIRVGVSYKPLAYIRGMQGKQATTITQALIGQVPKNPRLRLIVPNSSIKSFAPFTHHFAEHYLGYGWFSGHKVTRLVGKLEKMGEPFRDMIR